MTAQATRIALAAVRSAPTLLEAMHRGPALDVAAAADAASPAGESTATQLLRAAIDDPTDHLTAAIATLALGSVATESSARSLARVLDASAPHLKDYVVWALGRGPFIGSRPSSRRWASCRVRRRARHCAVWPLTKTKVRLRGPLPRPPSVIAVDHHRPQT